MENSDTYNRRLSAMSIIDCKSVLDFVATPVVLARIVDKRQRPWMLATNERDFLRWRPMELMLGDAWTKDKVDVESVRGRVSVSAWRRAVNFAVGSRGTRSHAGKWLFLGS